MSVDPGACGFDFNAYFPVKVCINLDRRPDRWRDVSREFARQGVEGVIRYPAVDGRSLDCPPGSVLTPGELGCLRSHLAVVREYHDAPRLMIFEDDCLLVPRFRERFAGYSAQLPDDWHLLLLGDHQDDRTDRVWHSENVAKAYSIWRTHAYALDQHIYDAFIGLCEQEREPVDGCTAVLQEIFDCYTFMPRLAWQPHTDSDIEHR